MYGLFFCDIKCLIHTSHTAHQDNECSAGTYHQRICKNAQSLYQTLFYRMTDCSYRSSIRCTTFTCFITEQTSLDTLYHCNAKNSASSLIESESILYNGKQNRWQTGDIPNNNTYSYQKINDSHHRNHGRRELSYSMDATEDDEQGEYSEGNSHGGRFDAPMRSSSYCPAVICISRVLA